MPTREFTTSRLRKAVYDPAARQLDLHWQGGKQTAYKPVPEEVFRRLCNAPTRRRIGKTGSRRSTPR